MRAELEAAQLFGGLGRRGPVPGERRVRLDTRAGPVDAALHPARGPRRGVLVGVHGLSPRGGADPRWVQLGRGFAALGFDVVHPHFPCVAGLRIEPAQLDRVEAAIAAVADDPRWAGPAPVGLTAVSFSAGLALAAAARPGLRGRVGPALLIGPYADLEGALRFIVRQPSPDPYALHLLLANFAEAALGPLPGLAPALRAAAGDNGAGLGDTAALHLRRLDPAVRARAEALLADPAARSALIDALRQRRPELLAALDPLRQLAAAAGDLRGPAVLLHGADDPVIPADQSRALAAHLRAAGCPTELLVSPLLGHGEPRASALLAVRPLLRTLGVFLTAASGERGG